MACPAKDDGSGGLTVIVDRERRARMTLTSAVPSKSRGTFIAKRVVAFMREVGCEQGDLVAKTGQEEAVKAMFTEVGRSQRRPKEESWSSKSVELVEAVPWRSDGDDMEAGGDALGSRIIDLSVGRALSEAEERERLATRRSSRRQGRSRKRRRTTRLTVAPGSARVAKRC